MKLKRFTSVLLSIGPVLYLVTIGVVTGGQMISYTIDDIYELLTSEQALKCSCKPNFIERCTSFVYDLKNPTCCAFCRHAPLPRCDCSAKGVAKCYDNEGDLSENLQIVPRRCCLVCSAMAKYATEAPPLTDAHTISTVAPTCVQSCLDRKFGGDLAKCYIECWRRYGRVIGRDPDTGKYPPKGAIVMSFSMLYRYEVIIMLAIRSLQVFAHTSLVLFVIMAALRYGRIQKPGCYSKMIFLWLYLGSLVLFGYLISMILLRKKNDIAFYYGMSVHVFIMAMAVWEFHQQKPGQKAKQPPTSSSSQQAVVPSNTELETKSKPKPVASPIGGRKIPTRTNI